MAFIVIQKGNYYYVKNTTTGKIGSNKFKDRINAEKQVKNRIRYQKLMNRQGLINTGQSGNQGQQKNKKGRKGKS